MSIFSDNLKKARKAIPGLSQDKASQLMGAGIKRANIDAWEHGRSCPPLSKFPRIVEVLGITDWVGFIMDPDFDPLHQKTRTIKRKSVLEQRFNKLPKELQKVAEALLNCA